MENIKNYFFQVKNSLSSFLNQQSGLVLFPLKKKIHSVLILFVVSFAVYFNTLGHQMAFDDEQAIVKNDFVLKGIKTIPSIFKHDSYYSYYRYYNIEKIWPGGRYRPLSLASFAVEQEFIGTWKEGVPRQFIWDTNGNGSADPDEDAVKDYVLNEDDFFARGTGLRHFNNILFFALSIVLIFIFFSVNCNTISNDVIFFSCLLFALHPLHTEVVANIKSRDEIFSLFFIFSTLIFSFRYFKSENVIDLFFSFISFLLSLLSKEYGVFLPIVFILILYLSTNERFKIDFKKLILPFLFIFLSCALLILIPKNFFVFIGLLLVNFFCFFRLAKSYLPKLFFSFSIALVIYFFLRGISTDQGGNMKLFLGNIITNPYLPATGEQEIASKIVVLFRYILNLIFPSNLSCDYSFSSLPYSDYSSPIFYLSVLTYLSLIIIGFYALLKRKIVALPIIWFLLFLFPTSNLIINIGATMGDRFVYHSSLGFCLLIAWPLSWINVETKVKDFARILSQLIVGLILAFFVLLTMNRNKDWFDNYTLFTSDVKKYPGNIVLLAGAAEELYKKAEKEDSLPIKKRLVEQSIAYIDKGLQINAAYYTFFNTLALDYYILKSYKESVSACRAGLKIFPQNKLLNQILLVISKDYVKMGIRDFTKKDFISAMEYFNKATDLDKRNADAFYNKAYIYKLKGDTANAIKNIDSALSIQNKKEFVKMSKELRQ